MTYILGFHDYDGTLVFLTPAGHTEYPEEAIQFDSIEKAVAARRLEEPEVRKNMAVFKYDSGVTHYIEGA